MKKPVIALVVLALIIPQIALASWWNPFTWFPSLFRKNIETSVQTSTPLPVIETSTSTLLTEQMLPVVVTPEKRKPQEPKPIESIKFQTAQLTVASSTTPTPSSVTPPAPTVVIKAEEVPPFFIDDTSDITKSCQGISTDRLSRCPAISNRVTITDVIPKVIRLKEKNWSALPQITVQGSNLGSNGETAIFAENDYKCSLDKVRFSDTVSVINTSNCFMGKVDSSSSNSVTFTIPPFLIPENVSVNGKTVKYLTFVIAPKNNTSQDSILGYGKFRIPLIEE